MQVFTDSKGVLIVRPWQAVAITLVLSAATATSAAAQSITPVAHIDSLTPTETWPVSHASRFEEFEARLNALEAQQSETNVLACIPSCAEPGCREEGFFYAGLDHVIVKPYFSRNLAYWNIVGPEESEFTSFDWDLAYTPRIYLGYETADGTGIQVRYWTFDSETSFSRTQQAGEQLYIETNLADNSPFVFVTDTLFGRHSIKTDVFDLEVTRRSDHRWGWIAVSGGVRYARLEQSAFWNDFASSQFLILNYDFEGIGPTLALEGGVPLCSSNVSFFAGGRGSLLFGNRSAFVTDDFPASDNIPTYDSLQPILEAQTGLDWSTEFWGFGLTVRAALEAQTWIRGGGASGGDDEGIPADQIDMGFFGGSFTTVVTF